MILMFIAERTELRLMKNQLKNILEITLVLDSYSVEDALFIILDKEPDIIIASNNMPGRSGFDLAYLLQKINFKSKVIILSDTQDNAIDAIKARVFDYLIYPFPGERLVKSVQKAIAEIENEKQISKNENKDEKMRVRLSSNSGFLLAELKQLSHCKADGPYTELYFTNGKTEYSSCHLGKIEKILTEYQFLRINRSMVINMRMLKEIDEKGEVCTIDTGNEIMKFPISKYGMKKLEEKKYFDSH
jgi:two-component system, LytTR family, response regulator